MQYNDSAYAAFEIIQMNRKAPRRYVIRYSCQTSPTILIMQRDTLGLEKFNKLIEDRENRPYFDQVLNHPSCVFAIKY